MPAGMRHLCRAEQVASEFGLDASKLAIVQTSASACSHGSLAVHVLQEPACRPVSTAWMFYRPAP